MTSQDAELPVPPAAVQHMVRSTLREWQRQAPTGITVEVAAEPCDSPNYWNIVVLAGKPDTPVDDLLRVVNPVRRRSRRSTLWQQLPPQLHKGDERTHVHDHEIAQLMDDLLHANDADQPAGRAASGQPGPGARSNAAEVRQATVRRN